MPIIVKTRRGHNSYTDYDIESPADLERLKRNIRHIGKAAKEAADPSYKKACLKVIAITLHQQNKPNHPTVKAVWKLLLKHIDKPTPAELVAKPETLFAPPKSRGGGSPRKKNTYEHNLTASLQTLLPSDKPPEKTQLNDPQWLADTVEKHAEDIEEHAIRRVELFFLLCVALYKTKRVIQLVDTDKQHGTATPGFRYAACHSSFFPKINDQSAERKTRRTADASILEGTHFAEVLNATVELPDCVNKFDSFCEGNNGENAKGLRRELQPILQKVSNGETKPLAAMMLFFAKMKTFFEGRALENAKKLTKQTPAAVKERIRVLEQKGTFYWTDEENKQPSVGAVSAWLRVREEDANLFLTQPDTAEETYDRIKNEILNSRPVPVASRRLRR